MEMKYENHTHNTDENNSAKLKQFTEIEVRFIYTVKPGVWKQFRETQVVFVNIICVLLGFSSFVCCFAPLWFLYQGL